MSGTEPLPPPSAADSPSATDSEMALLVRQAQAGSAEALGRLLETARRYLLLVANEELDSAVRPKGGASDLVQETFVEAQGAIEQFRGSTQRELLAWLAQILRHRVAHHHRHYRDTLKRSVDRELPLDAQINRAPWDVADSQPLSVDEATARDEERRLHAALDRLPDHLRQVLFLRTWEQRTFEEVAQQTGGTAESVRKLWSRAVRRLQQELRETS